MILYFFFYEDMISCHDFRIFKMLYEVEHINNSIQKHFSLIRHGGSQPPTKYDLNDMMFPDEDLDFGSLSEIYYTSNQENDSLDNTFISTDYMADQEQYLERVSSLQLVIENKFDRVPRQSVLNETRCVKDSTERQRKIGIKAEHFFSCWLKNKYGDSYNVFENWLSKARNTVYPSRQAYASDTLGYDFMIKDYLNVFSTNVTQSVKKCFIEVKGTESFWDGTFHLSRNEKSFRDKVSTNTENETYLIVVIENVYDPNLIDIARIINWSANSEAIALYEETYLASLVFSYESESHNYNLQYFDSHNAYANFLPLKNSLNNPNPSRYNSNYRTNRTNQKSNKNLQHQNFQSITPNQHNEYKQTSGRNNSANSSWRNSENNNYHLNNDAGNRGRNNNFSNDYYNNTDEQTRMAGNSSGNNQSRNRNNYKR